MQKMENNVSDEENAELVGLAMSFVEAAVEKLSQRNKTRAGTSSQTHQEHSSSSGTVSTSSLDPSSRSIYLRGRAAANFQKSFPALSGRNIKHKNVRQMLPSYSSATKTNTAFVIPYPIKETWTHEFCCVPYTFQNTTPSMNQLEMLKRVGHGKKKIVFSNRTFGYEEVCEELFKQFPQLKNVGGFTLHRAKHGGQGRPLVPLQTKWYGIKNLKDAGVGSACIYIKPLQKSFDLNVSFKNQDGVIDGPTTKCITCQKDIELHHFKKHKANCCPDDESNIEFDDDVEIIDNDNNDREQNKVKTRKRQRKEYTELPELFTDDEIDDFMLPASHTGSLTVADLADKQCDICKMLLLDGNKLSKPCKCSCIFHHICLEEWLKTGAEGDKAVSCPTCNFKFESIEDLKLIQPVSEQADNLKAEEDNKAQDLASFNSLEEAMKANLENHVEDLLSQSVDEDDDDDKVTHISLHVRRSYIWEDSQREFTKMTPKEWHPKVKVRFMKEAGEDTGGLSREYFSLIYSAVLSSGLLVGETPYLTFSHNQNALEAGKYNLFGKIVALSLLNGYCGPNNFSQVLTDFILGCQPVNDPKILLKELPNNCKELRLKLKKISECKTEVDFSKLIADLDERFDFGYSKSYLTLEDKVPLLQAACKHYLVSCCLEEILSCKDGLELYGVLNVLKHFNNESRELFINQKIAVKDIEEMFHPSYSEEGSNKRSNEEQIYFHWMQFLKEANRRKLKRNVTSLEEIEVESVDASGEQSSAEARVLGLSDILQFMSGARTKPLACFKGKIRFDHEVSPDSNKRAESNTCALEMVIPVNKRYLESCDNFVSNLTDDIFDGPDFGKI